MKLAGKAIPGIVAAAAVAIAAISASAQDQRALEGAIKARQGAMQIHSFEVGPIFAMAKGDRQYDAEAASAHATALASLLNYDESRLFVPGTSNAEMPDKTRALPAIWERPDEFHQAFEDLRTAVEALAAEAGNGQEALAAAAGPVGNACGDCHETFRQRN